MRIRSNKPQDPTACARAIQDLKELLAQPEGWEERPCSDCDATCSCSQRSKTCACDCSVNCFFAPEGLSSDKERYPVEEQIVSLVYAFSTLRLFPTCWSCEGHVDADGAVAQVPQLWFYCSSITLLDLIAECLGDLGQHHLGGRTWTVTALQRTDPDSPPRFAIRPDPNFACSVKFDLPNLQAEANVIAARLRAEIMALARRRLESHEAV